VETLFFDDVFAVFTCSQAEIETFTNGLNAQNKNIQFTSEMSIDGIPFLDTWVTIENNKQCAGS
jgi:hypothetical protein